MELISCLVFFFFFSLFRKLFFFFFFSPFQEAHMDFLQNEVGKKKKVPCNKSKLK